MSNVASRIYKKRRFLQLWGSVPTTIWLRDAPFAPSVAFGRHDGQNHDFRPKSLPKKAASGTGKQHGLASSRTPLFDLRWSDLQCQTSRPEPIKKGGLCSFGAQFAPRFGFEMHRLHLRLRLGITTGKTTTSDPKAFPKRLPPEQGNSMAWRAQ